MDLWHLCMSERLMSLRPPQKAPRKDVENYVRSCEYLISVASVPNSPPFSKEEHRLLERYTEQMAKLLSTHKKGDGHSSENHA
jgi:hypothetical protein